MVPSLKLESEITMKTKLILLTAFFATVVLVFTLTASATIPHLMNFQGKATDKSGAPLNGVYNLTFRIYNIETIGTPKWIETQPSITISNGIFQVRLGSVTPLNLPFDEAYWISLEINTDGEMSPRTRLASVPYAYKAESLADAPVIPFYKKGFDIECADFNSVKITPGVMDVAGKMFTATTYSDSLNLAYLDGTANRDWVHGQKTNGSVVYVYAYNNNNGRIGFKFSDETPNLADHLGNSIQRPLLYRRYPDTAQGVYYRYVGNLTINTTGTISAIISQGKTEPASIFSVFGGDGAGGDVVVSSNTNFSTIDDPVRPGIAQFKNLTINNGQILTIDSRLAYIGVSGTLTMHGTISADGKGAVGATSAGGVGQNAERIGGGITSVGSGNQNVGTNYMGNDILREDVIISGSNGSYAITGGGGTLQWKIANCLTGAGGSGGASGPGGGAGGWGAHALGSGSFDCINAGATAASKFLQLTGGLGDNSTHSVFFNPAILGFVGAGGGCGLQGGVGGNGGGCVYIECNELVFDGALTANGANGETISNAYWGGGGGGGGGMIYVRAKTITTNSGTVTATGGIGGNSGYVKGGDGAAGFKDIVAVQ